MQHDKTMKYYKIFFTVSFIFFCLFRLKQLENQKARIAEDLHEMDKPMARDRNDGDLDAHLKAVEREEDPMLQYMRKKQKRKETASGLPRK